MSALPHGSSGVSCWEPNVHTRPQRRHVGGQQFTKHDDRTFQRLHTCPCGWEGIAEVFQCVSFETFRCGGCGADVTVWDELDVDRDGGDPPHMDGDWLDGPPESLERRG